MYIQLEWDYNADHYADRKKMVYVHINDLNDEENDEGGFALANIKDGSIFWHGDENSGVIAEATGETFGVFNLLRLVRFIKKHYPNSDIDMAEMNKRWDHDDD